MFANSLTSSPITARRVRFLNVALDAIDAVYCPTLVQDTQTILTTDQPKFGMRDASTICRCCPRALIISSSKFQHLFGDDRHGKLFNRPPSIAQDTLKYTIYPPPSSADRSAATCFAVAVRSFVDSVLTQFIWHRDPFELKVVKDPDSNWLASLRGLMRVGDSVDDEWCVVWLLREISAKWDLAVR